MLCCFFSLLQCYVFFFFFFQAEDGIRDRTVTGVQTCALPIWCSPGWRSAQHGRRPTLREQSALPILPRGAEFGLSLWSFLLLVGFTWNFGSHFELCNRRAGWDQAARPSSPFLQTFSRPNAETHF